MTANIQRDNVLKRLPPFFRTDSDSLNYGFFDAIGQVLNSVDAGQINLASEFSVTSATGAALDAQGADWGVSRRYNESDASYRKRILSVLPQYATGPTIENIKAVVRSFTGVDPDIFEYGPDSFTMGVSVMGTFGFSATGDAFTFLVTVHNPNNVQFNQADLQNAVMAAAPARSSAQFVYV